MVLALSLPFGFPHREQLITMTYGVVLLTLLLQGTTMSWLLRRLDIVESQDLHAVPAASTPGEPAES
jgi:CPA1 family monovalent cation:H+ antiporter